MTDNQQPSNENRPARESRFGGPQAQRGGEPEGGRRPSGGGRRSGGGGRFSPRRKVCAFCTDNIQHVDYKDLARLRRHVG